jgi:hypothetical protein
MAHILGHIRGTLELLVFCIASDDTAAADIHLHRIGGSAHGAILPSFLLCIQDRIHSVAASSRDEGTYSARMDGITFSLFTQGARTLYFTVLRPLLASKGPSSAVNVPSPDSGGAAH